MADYKNRPKKPHLKGVGCHVEENDDNAIYTEDKRHPRLCGICKNKITGKKSKTPWRNFKVV